MSLKTIAGQALAQDFNDNFSYLESQKATKAEVQSMADGSPKGVYATLTDLQTAYPAGDAGAYLVTADGHWYYWSGSAWADGGQYQSAGIADNSVEDKHIKTVGTTKIKNTLLSLKDFSKWGNTSNTLSVDNDVLTFIKTVDGDSGVKSPTLIPAFEYETIYIVLQLEKTNASGEIACHLFNTSNAYIQPTGDLVEGYNRIEISKSIIEANSLQGGFYIVIASHDIDVSFNISRFGISANDYGADFEDIIEKIKTEDIGGDRLTSGSVTIDKIDTDVLRTNNILSSAGTETNNFPGTFSESHLTKTIQEDGSIICVSADGIQTPAIRSRNINAEGKCAIGSVLRIKFVGKSVDGGNALVMAYREDTYASITSSKVVVLNEEYKTYEVDLGIINNVPSDVACYALIKINPVVEGIGYQYAQALWLFDDEGEFTEYLDESVDKLNDVYKSIGGITETFVGQGRDLSDASKYEKIAVTGYHYVTPNVLSDGDNVLKTLQVYAENAGDYDFIVGTIDQYNLIVSSNGFTKTCNAGYNKIDVESDYIEVPYGSQVFMDISKSNTLYNPNPAALKEVSVRVQDESQTIDENGYSGMIMHDTPYMIPFGYVLKTSSIKNKIEELENEVGTLKNSIAVKPDTMILQQPDGTKMELCVDTTGALTTRYYHPRKVTVLGNSLTLGFGDFGMAASDQYHDYFYLLKQHLQGFYPSVEMDRYSSSSWEGYTTSQERQDWWDNTMGQNLDTDEDLVIIQLVDNVNTTEKEATFAEDAKTLIENIRTKCQKAKVIWVAGWYVSDWEIDAIKDACEEKGAIFCDITQYKSDVQYKSAIGNIVTLTDGSTLEIDSSGVASHPGDLGMQKIAESIIATLGLE